MPVRPPAVPPAPDLASFALALGAVAAAAGAQRLVVDEQPWESVAGFCLAGGLIALAARRRVAAAEREPAPPPPLGGVFTALVGVGIILCGVAGVLVYQRLPPGLTHPVWGAGLLGLAGAAMWPQPDVRPARWPRRQTLVCGALLLLAAGSVFAWDLPALPVEVHGDDAEVGLDAVRLLHNFDLFYPGWFKLPMFHAFPTAVGLAIFGVNLLGLRATSAAFGIGSVLLLFAVARRLWGVEVALLAGLLLASQRFFIHLSRAGYHYVDTPFLSLLVVWLFLRLWQDRRRGAAIWCGVALGLGIQTYYASRLVPALLAFTWLGWLAGTPTAERRGRIVGFGVIGLVALAVAAPMFGYSAHNWNGFWERTRDTSLFTTAHRADDFATVLLIQLRAAVTLFNATPDTSVQYGFDGPLFEPVSAALFVLGAALVLSRLRERRARLALLWIVVPLVVGAALTINTPFYPRISGLVPFGVLIIALALQALRDAVWAAVPTRWGARLLTAVTVGVMALIAANNLRSYFVDYAARFRHSPCVEIAAWVRAHGGGKTTYMVGGAPAFSIRHAAIAFLTEGYDTRDIDDLDRFLLSQPLDATADVFVVMPNGTHVIPQLEHAVGPVDLQTHRDRDGLVAFLTAIPHGHGSEPADPAERFDQPSAPGAGIAALGEVLDAIAGAAQGLLAAVGAAVVVLALVGWAHRQCAA